MSLAGRVHGKAAQCGVACPEEETTLGRDYSKSKIREQEGYGAGCYGLAGQCITRQGPGYLLNHALIHNSDARRTQ